jgi:hypothetical protein
MVRASGTYISTGFWRLRGSCCGWLSALESAGGVGPARGPWTNLGRLPFKVLSIGKYAFQKKESAGAEVAGCESLARSHPALRMQPAHLSSALRGQCRSQLSSDVPSA